MILDLRYPSLSPTQLEVIFILLLLWLETCGSCGSGILFSATVMQPRRLAGGDVDIYPAVSSIQTLLLQ